MSRVPGLDLTTETSRLVAAEHLLSEYLPNMLTKDRLELAITLRRIFDGEMS